MSNVFITGTSSGFGFLIAKTLLGAGHNVFAGMRDQGKAAENVAALKEAASSSKGSLQILMVDVVEGETVDRAVGKIIAEAGHIDVVVNNAGLGGGGYIEGYTPEQFEKVFDVNVFGVQRVLRAVLPHMRERKAGLCITTGSSLGRYVLPFMGPYAMTKFALECMNDLYRMELAPFGIEFTLVQPGGYPTSFLANGQQPADGARLATYGEFADAPMKMFGPFAEFLASPNAPNPQVVADKVAELIAMPAGSRPDRANVDLMMGEALEAINKTCAAVQAQIAANSGK
jgi:NAD(P)-dependent dehydrogenase (short-subunit alcohol dehydrogenase family)